MESVGRIKIVCCPLAYIGPDAREAVEAAMMQIEQNIPPLAGGQLDQCENYLEVLRMKSR